MIQSKCWGNQTKDDVLLQENVCPHTTTHTVQTLQKLWSEILQYPSYSPDLAPLDFHLHGLLKDALRGHCFVSERELIWQWCICRLPAGWKHFFNGIYTFASCHLPS
jgi:hypothetical protein